MPRLIPRLLRNLQHARNRILKPPQEVNVSPSGRTQSILLDRKAVRLIFRHARHQREKGLAPEVRISRTQWRAKQRSGRAPPGAMPRAMTREERSFYGNPYLRMLGSPLRKCYETGWVLPRDLMIRMAPSIVPGDKTQTAYLPSGIEHAAFRRFRGGKSNYLLCWKPVFEQTLKTGATSLSLTLRVRYIPAGPVGRFLQTLQTAILPRAEDAPSHTRANQPCSARPCSA
ncbi:hypothetical protein BD311DRAFT_652983 [Dichomitus squalens]|uniref:Uncharacterized protein n=1 Tax=Dichomitus squalens TaxID=114155 RepID=A0A4Q9MYK0_9APHY|nr:hypothetical protein BD311DRAFT_652983 [Dichomitus squalens]